MRGGASASCDLYNCTVTGNRLSTALGDGRAGPQIADCRAFNCYLGEGEAHPVSIWAFERLSV